MPKITGIMLCLNEMFYIRASVLNALQHVDELLILDGESEDGTLEWLRRTERKNEKLRVLLKPQKDKRHYHPSWDQPKRWNRLIEEAAFDWIFVIGADECFCDQRDLHKIIKNKPNAHAFRFPRYALIDEYHYTPNWYPDYQMRLFNRTSHHGIRYKDIPRHCTPRTKMGKGASVPAISGRGYLVHYHHGFGPKIHKLSKSMKVEKLPEGFKHPKMARKFIIDQPIDLQFQYDFRLYGKPGWVPKAARE